MIAFWADPAPLLSRAAWSSRGRQTGARRGDRPYLIRDTSGERYGSFLGSPLLAYIRLRSFHLGRELSGGSLGVDHLQVHRNGIV